MALIFEVKVVPSSGQYKWILDKNRQLKCYLKSPPEKGKANRELVKILAAVLECSQQNIELVGGLTARKKRVKVDSDLTYDQVLERLGLGNEKQLKIY